MSPLYSTVRPIKFLRSDVMWHKYYIVCVTDVITNDILNIGISTSPYSFLKQKTFKFMSC